MKILLISILVLGSISSYAFECTYALNHLDDYKIRAVSLVEKMMKEKGYTLKYDGNYSFALTTSSEWTRYFDSDKAYGFARLTDPKTGRILAFYRSEANASFLASGIGRGNSAIRMLKQSMKNIPNCDSL